MEPVVGGLTSFEQHLKEALPLDSSLRRLLRRLKLDLNELLWTVKPGWPQIGQSPELAQLRRIARVSDESSMRAQGKPILLFSMRSWRIHKMWDGILGRGLLERGARPTVLLCDGLPRCDMFGREAPGHSSVHCAACLAYTRQVFHLFGLPMRYLSEFLVPSDRSEARDLVGTWSGDLESLVADGWPLGELVRPSVIRTLLRGSVERDPLSLRLYREYLEGGILLSRALGHALDALQPETVIMMNGMFFAERIGMAIARQRKLHTVTHERGFMRNRLVLAHDEPANWFRVDAAWSQAAARPLAPEAEAELNGYLRYRESGKDEVVNYWPTVEARHDYIVNQLGLESTKPILTAFTNVLWDTAVYQRDVAFAGMFHWLEATIEAVASIPALQLVIRVHPAEVRLRQRTRERVLDRLAERFPTLPANVVIVPPESAISSYALVDLSTAVTVYTSTIGLEAALRGIPVLVAGQTHYRSKGFTHDVESPGHYVALLAELSAWPRLPEESVSLARRYAHLFFLRNMLPLDLVTESNDGSVQLGFRSFAALQPGQHPILDHICAAIVGQKDFALP
jgi:hypothetical protein